MGLRVQRGRSLEAPILLVGTAARAGPWAHRSLSRGGRRVIAANPGRLLDGASWRCLTPEHCPSPSDEPELFRAWISEVCRRERPRAILTTLEDVTRILALAPPDLGDTVVAGPNAEQFTALCDKGELAEVAAYTGVSHPEQTVVETAEDARGLPAAPVVVKPRRSSEQVPIAALLAGNAARRDEAVTTLLDSGAGAVVQEMVHGTQFVVHAVRGDGGLLGVVGRVESRWPRSVGTPSVIRRVDMPHALAAVERLLAAVDYRGPVNVQFIERDGELYLHDVNLRVPASIALAMRAGLDQPLLGVMAALNEPLPTMPALRDITYVCTDGEVGALRARVRGRSSEPMRPILRRLARGTRRAGMLDPTPLDPVWLGDMALTAARRSRPARALKAHRRRSGRED
jgi:ATP-grasp in the biosynthetic pathway with Ter operon